MEPVEAARCLRRRPARKPSKRLGRFQDEARKIGTTTLGSVSEGQVSAVGPVKQPGCFSDLRGRVGMAVCGSGGGHSATGACLQLTTTVLITEHC